MGRSKVIIMVPIWKCVGLTPIWSNFPDVHHLYLYPLGWHTLPLHANAEACLTGWPNA